MSTPAPITVVARWQMAPASVDQVMQLVAELRQQSLTEPGCLAYDAYRSIDVEGVVLLVERYCDDAALEAHRNTAHYQALVVGRIVPMLTDRQVSILQTRAPA